MQALHLPRASSTRPGTAGYTKLNLVDIGGGFPAPYDATVKPFRELAKVINTEFDRLFPQGHRDPGRAGPLPGGHAPATPCRRSSARPSATARRCYYIDDGVYHTYSGVIFDHCQYPVKAFKRGPTQICSVFGPTCDALDTISLAEDLPELERGDFVYSENIGAYSHASSTYFNGFPPAKVVHVNQ